MRRVKPRAIRAFKNGDKDAFEEIFYAYKDILYYLCYFYIRDYDDASDCVQEIFIKLTSKISLYDERKAAFEAWFLALTKAHIFNFIRDKNRYNNRIDLCYNARWCRRRKAFQVLLAAGWYVSL